MSDLFPYLPIHVSLDEQLACVEREIKMRERVYPGLVENGKMSRPQADLEITKMRAVLTTLRSLKHA